eukprot:scaffold2072_cov126-Isochrysis_galbana.AAC.18
MSFLVAAQDTLHGTHKAPRRGAYSPESSHTLTHSSRSSIELARASRSRGPRPEEHNFATLDGGRPGC